MQINVKVFWLLIAVCIASGTANIFSAVSRERQSKDQGLVSKSLLPEIFEVLGYTTSNYGTASTQDLLIKDGENLKLIPYALNSASAENLPKYVVRTKSSDGLYGYYPLLVTLAK